MMVLLKVRCIKTLIMEVHHNIWEDESETFIDANQLDISFYKGKEYVLFKCNDKGKIFVTLNENGDVHKLSYDDLSEFFHVLDKKVNNGN